VQHIETSGPDTALVTTLATQALAGTNHYILPRNSILFLPENAIRTAILAADPTIQAVSIARTGFSSMLITVIPRSSAFWWCGQSITATTTSPCYQSDGEGFLFAPVASSSTAVDIPNAINSTASLQNSSSTDLAPPLPATVPLMVYAPLTASSTGAPIGSTVADAAAMPMILRFVRLLESLHANIVSVQIRGDEADLYVKSGTRITYVIGDEDAAATRAEAAFPQLNLDDGSIDYVDLRFDGKVYFKATASTSQS
jgi:hypothetical protein